MIWFSLPIKPVPKGRPRFYRGHAITDKRTREFEKTFRMLAARKLTPGFKPLEGPLRLSVFFTYKAPKKSSKGYPRPDLDNLIKCCDAFNGLIWKDDAQIVSIVSEKSYGEEDKITVCVTELNLDS